MRNMNRIIGGKQMRHPTGEPDDLIIYADKGKVVGSICLGIVLTACGVVVTVVPDPSRPDMGIKVIGPLYVLIVGGATVGLISRLFSSAPRLIINHQGIYLNSLLLGVGLIDWGEISGLVAYAAPLQQTRLRIMLTDPRSILARQPWPQRLLYLIIKGNLMDSEAIVTSDALLPISTHELLAQIRERYHHELLHDHVVIRERQRK